MTRDVGDHARFRRSPRQSRASRLQDHSVTKDPKRVTAEAYTEEVRFYRNIPLIFNLLHDPTGALLIARQHSSPTADDPNVARFVHCNAVERAPAWSRHRVPGPFTSSVPAPADDQPFISHGQYSLVIDLCDVVEALGGVKGNPRQGYARPGVSGPIQLVDRAMAVRILVSRDVIAGLTHGPAILTGWASHKKSAY